MQGSGSFRLIVRRGPQPNQIYELNKDVITLGRDITNDIVINDPEVSRHHCRMTRSGGGYTLEDLGSTNGTFGNGQRLGSPRPLSNNEMIGLGETVTLVYEAALAGVSPDFSPRRAAACASLRELRPPRWASLPPPAEQPYRWPRAIQRSQQWAELRWGQRAPGRFRRELRPRPTVPNPATANLSTRPSAPTGRIRWARLSAVWATVPQPRLSALPGSACPAESGLGAMVLHWVRVLHCGLHCVGYCRGIGGGL